MFNLLAEYSGVIALQVGVGFIVVAEQEVMTCFYLVGIAEFLSLIDM